MNHLRTVIRVGPSLRYKGKEAVNSEGELPFTVIEKSRHIVTEAFDVIISTA